MVLENVYLLTRLLKTSTRGMNNNCLLSYGTPWFVYCSKLILPLLPVVLFKYFSFFGQKVTEEIFHVLCGGLLLSMPKYHVLQVFHTPRHFSFPTLNFSLWFYISFGKLFDRHSTFVYPLSIGVCGLQWLMFCIVYFYSEEFYC